MSRAKQRKHFDKPERAVIAKQNEKIINDFLLQFAYTLTMCVVTIFVFNALGAFKYGLGAYTTTKFIVWTLFVVCLALGIFSTVMYKLRNKDIQKTSAIYYYITSFVMFWYVGVEKIPYYLQNVLPFMSKFTGTYKVILALFPLLGIALVAEFVVYFIRYYSLNGKRKK